MPSFRSGAIWPNTQITAIFFLLSSIVFLLRWENKKIKIINTNLILSLFFMSLAVYTRQLYALVFLFYLYIFFTKLNLKNFILVTFIIFSLALPGLYFIYKVPSILTFWFSPKAEATSYPIFFNTILINLSIISFYLLPIYLFLFFDKKIKINLKNLEHLFTIFFCY